MERERHIRYEIVREKMRREATEDNPTTLSDWIESDVGVLFETTVAMKLSRIFRGNKL
jgi:hypothetical protein